MVGKETTLRVPAGCRPGHERKGRSGFSDSVEEYIEGIYRLQNEVDLVSTGEVAIYMSVSAGSATTMIKKLAELGLAYHEPYQGIRLSPSGEHIAKKLLHTHRLLEVFLQSTLDLKWHEVHEVACKLEHYLSDMLIERIDEKMGHPKTCPHGSPIDLDQFDETIKLSDVDPGDTVTIRKVTDERSDFLLHLESVGLTIGKRILVESSSAIDSLIHLNVDGNSVTVGQGVSNHVWVTYDSQS
jgi:DtxR family Mn-dependent transcriptional regulator